MAEEQKPLGFIQETVLKKRRNNEEWAINRREQVEARKQIIKNKAKFAIKRPEQFVKEYRDKELDLIRMKHRVKRQKIKISQDNVKSNLLFVARIQGANDMHPKTRKCLKLMRLGERLTGVFMKADESTLKSLLRVDPFVTYGYPNAKNVKELIHKKGRGWVDNQVVPLTNNNVIEEVLGKHGIICLEDMIHEIYSVERHFKEVSSFLCPIKLKKPESIHPLKKKQFKAGGDSGNREDLINEFIDRWN